MYINHFLQCVITYPWCLPLFMCYHLAMCTMSTTSLLSLVFAQCLHCARIHPCLMSSILCHLLSMMSSTPFLSYSNDILCCLFHIPTMSFNALSHAHAWCSLITMHMIRYNMLDINASHLAVVHQHCHPWRYGMCVWFKFALDRTTTTTRTPNFQANLGLNMTSGTICVNV